MSFDASMLATDDPVLKARDAAVRALALNDVMQEINRLSDSHDAQDVAYRKVLVDVTSFVLSQMREPLAV